MGFENGKLVRVTLTARKSAELQINTFHYDIHDSVTTGSNDPQSLADFFRDNVIIHQRALYDSSWQILPVTVIMERDPLAPNDPRSEWVSGTATNGTNTTGGDRLPHGLCAVATLKTATIGRRHTGRVFIGGSWTEENQGSGNWLAGTLALMEAYLASVPLEPDISGGVETGGCKLCVYSRTQRAANLDPYASAVTSHVLHPEAHYLRRRAGVGA